MSLVYFIDAYYIILEIGENVYKVYSLKPIYFSCFHIILTVIVKEAKPTFGW